MQQTATWRILLRVLEGKRRGELDQEAERRRWAGQIALDQAERTVAKHVPLTTASGWKLARLTMRPVGASSYRVSWQCDCRLEGLALFASPRSAKATGTFQLRFDRFERPEAMIEAVADFAGED